VIFAIYDRIDFGEVAGRYTVFQSSKLETWCYYDFIPDKVLAHLDVGDVILVGNNDDWLSWIIMYLTDSTFSHLMMYDPEGFVAHMTLDGYCHQRISELFGLGMRFLPARHRVVIDRPNKKSRLKESLKNLPPYRYGYARPLLVGLSLILCISPLGFHRRQFGDLCYFLFVSAFLAIPFSAGFALWQGALSYLCLVFVYQIICRKLFGRRPFFAGTPEHIWRLCEYGEFQPFLNIEGFQKYMLSMAEVLKKEYGELKPGFAYPIPEKFGRGTIVVSRLSEAT
jgi:hypothetical protein